MYLVRARIHRGQNEGSQSRLVNFDAGEYFPHLPLGWRFEDTARREFLSLWILCTSNALGSLGEIVAGAPKLDVRAEQGPISARFTKRHAHASGVHHASRSNRSVKLHVRVAADDHR